MAGTAPARLRRELVGLGFGAFDMAAKKVRNLMLVLGDQLDHAATTAAALDPARDAVWMAEVDEEAIPLFFLFYSCYLSFIPSEIRFGSLASCRQSLRMSCSLITFNLFPRFS